MSLQVNVCVEVIDTGTLGQPAIVRVLRGETVLPPNPDDTLVHAELLGMLRRVVVDAIELARVHPL